MCLTDAEFIEKEEGNPGNSVPFIISKSHSLAGVWRVEGDHCLCSHQGGDAMSPISMCTL